MFPFLTKDEEVDAQEAFNLWDSLRSRYDAIETVQIHDNFIHDQDLKFVSNYIIEVLTEKQINMLEDKMNNYSLSMPFRPPKSAKTPVNVEAFHDRYIGSVYLNLFQSFITMEIRAIRTSFTNDNIREMYYKFLKDEVDIYNRIIKYAKIKGWISIPPKHPSMPEDTKGEISSTEAFHLWDHLTARYDAIQLTQIYSNFAHDPEFKTILNRGLRNTLEKQVNLMEEKMNFYGLPLPQRPSKSVYTQFDMEIFGDDIMFRNLLTWIQFTLVLHVFGLKQSSTHDPIRKMFCNFLFEELDLFDKLVKYGKIKGWLRPVPMFRTAKQ